MSRAICIIRAHYRPRVCGLTSSQSASQTARSLNRSIGRTLSGVSADKSSRLACSQSSPMNQIKICILLFLARAGELEFAYAAIRRKSKRTRELCRSPREFEFSYFPPPLAAATSSYLCITTTTTISKSHNELPARKRSFAVNYRLESRQVKLLGSRACCLPQSENFVGNSGEASHLTRERSRSRGRAPLAASLCLMSTRTCTKSNFNITIGCYRRELESLC